MRFVVAGSVAVASYGVDLDPGDLDIVPETSGENLRRLAQALTDLEAQPLGPFGSWTRRETGEWKWAPRPTSERELAEWAADPGDVDSFDHLFVTRLGNLDVVPRIAGDYDRLAGRAVPKSSHGVLVPVAHVDELLARLTIPRREKDRDRVRALRRIQAGLPPGPGKET